MVDKKKITSIDSAKNYNQYDGGGLDNAQKLVFDQLAIPKNADGTPKITELQEVAETLEKVIKAKKATVWDISLYNELNGIKIDAQKKYIYEAINYNGQYEAALIHLNSKQTPGTPTPGTDEASVQQEINILTTSIANFNAEIGRVQASKKITENDLAIQINLKTKKLQEIKKIEELQLRLRNQGTVASGATFPGGTAPEIELKKGIRPILDVNGNNVNDNLRELTNLSMSNRAVKNPIPIWKSEINENVKGYSSGLNKGRQYVSKIDAESLNYQIMEFLQEIDDQKMLTKIGNNSNLKQIWKDLKESTWYIERYDINDPDTDMAGNVQVRTEYKKEKQDGKLVLVDEKEDIVKKGLGWIDHHNFFELMRTVFPSGNIGLSNAKDLEPGKLKNLRLRTFSKDDYADKNINTTTGRPKKPFFEWFRTEFPNRKDELVGIEYKDFDLQKVVEFFWDVYPSSATVFSATPGDNSNTAFAKWDEGITGLTQIHYETHFQKEWVKGIRNGGYSKSEIGDGQLNLIFSENLKFDEAFYEKNVYDDENSEYIRNYISLDKDRFGPSQEDFELYDPRLLDEETSLEKSLSTVLTGENKPVGGTLTVITNANLDADCSGYLWIDGFNGTIAQKQGEVSSIEAAISGFSGPLNEFGKNEANLKAQKASLEVELAEKTKKLAEFKTKDLNENITKWNNLYGSGPGTAKKYTKLEVWEIEKLYYIIADQSKVRGVSVDSDVQTKWEKFKKEITDENAVAEGHISRLIFAAKTDGQKTDGLSKDNLIIYQGYFDKVAKARTLEDNEQSLLDVIKQRIAGTYKGDDIPTPTSDLTGPTLLVLLGAKTGVKDSDVRLSEWQKMKVYKTVAKIKELIESVRPAGVVNTSFQDHLAAHDSWGINKIAKGDDQWDTFIKNKPEHVIGAIKLFTDYESKLPDSKERKDIDEAIDKANNDPKADETDKWDKTDKKHLSEFLYKKAEGKKGEELIRKTKEEETPKTPTNDSEKSWWDFGTTTGKVLWIGGGSVLVIGVLAVIFWKNISEWWNGPTEEEGGQADNKDDDKENEEE